MQKKRLLIITNSFDTTADLLVFRLGEDNVFRFNYDLWHDYAFEITAEGVFLEDPSGREIRSVEIAKVLWRKPWSRRAYRPASRTSEDLYYDGEMLYALRELVNLLWMDGKIVLVEPFAELHVGKFIQLRVAADYLRVPQYQFRRRTQSIFSKNQDTIVKSLTMEPVGNEQERELLFTTRVEDESLSAECPWMVQEYIEAEKDITVAFVYDELFAFELTRTELSGRMADWRELPSDWEQGDWNLHLLPDEIASGIYGFMNRLGLQFGRLDFLWGKNGYSFLEVNTNGEWAWLDTEGRYGLLQKVLTEVSPDTKVHAVPFLRFQSRR